MLSWRSAATALAVLLGVAGAAGAAWAQQMPNHARAPEQQEPVAAVGPQRIEMVVHGLTCPFCAYGLEKKLRKIAGLDSLSVEFKTGQVVLLVRDGAKATDERLRQLVKDAGFEVAKIERAPRAKAPS